MPRDRIYDVLSFCPCPPHVNDPLAQWVSRLCSHIFMANEGPLFGPSRLSFWCSLGFGGGCTGVYLCNMEYKFTPISCFRVFSFISQTFTLCNGEMVVAIIFFPKILLMHIFSVLKTEAISIKYNPGHHTSLLSASHPNCQADERRGPLPFDAYASRDQANRGLRTRGRPSRKLVCVPVGHNFVCLFVVSHFGMGLELPTPFHPLPFFCTLVLPLQIFLLAGIHF